MFDIFGKYGAVRQIRLGNTNTTRGTAYVVYEDIFDAKAACDNLNGFQVAGRYLIVRWSHSYVSLCIPSFSRAPPFFFLTYVSMTTI